MKKTMMMRLGRFSLIALGGSFAGLHACSSSSDKASSKQEQLDIAMPKPAGNADAGTPADAPASPPANPASEAQTAGSQAAGPQAAAPLASSALLNWQDFFKPPPSGNERSQLTRALAKRPGGSTNQQALLARARQEAALGLQGKAEATYRQILRQDGEQLDAKLELAMTYLRRKDHVAAIALLSSLRESLSEREQVATGFVFRYRYTLALAYLLQGQRAKSHEILSDLIALDKSFTPGYAALASSYLQQDKLVAAEFVVSRGFDRGKEDPALLNLMGVISEKKGQLDKAEFWYDKALAKNTSFAPTLTNKAILSLKRFEYEQAKALLLQSLALQPHNVEAHIALGIVQEKTGKAKEARQTLDKVLELDPGNPMARYNLALLMMVALHKPNEALRLFHEVIQSPEAASELKEMAGSHIDDIKNNRASF